MELGLLFALDRAVGGQADVGDDFAVWVWRNSASRVALPIRSTLLTLRILRS
jgi:hypothetical protein